MTFEREHDHASAPAKIPVSLLLASSVHDIKNSLGMLLSTLETVITTTPQHDDVQRGHFATLQGEAARINNALISLLGLYRLQNDQLPVRVQQIFVADFLDEQITANHLLFNTRNLEVELDCEPDLRGYFDVGLIGGVINNVLVNAANYAKQRIRIRARRDDNELLLEVYDDGPGFPDKMLRSPFNAERGIDFVNGSTHLGLYFAGEIARLHGRGDNEGRIEISNLEQGGGCFRLWLP